MIMPRHLPAFSPRFVHHCERCRFLGRLDFFDLYHCTEGDMPHVSARFGEERFEFTSRSVAVAALGSIGVIAVVNNDDLIGRAHRALRIAYLIVRDMGLAE